MENTKICIECKEEKVLIEFQKSLIHGKIYYRSRCRKCQYKLVHELRKRATINLHEWLDNCVKNKPCVDCGGRFNPWQMDFDHRDGILKEAGICELVNKAKPMEMIKKEIAKCDLVCSNCHRERTYRRSHNL
jgi:hypothetical protein